MDSVLGDFRATVSRWRIWHLMATQDILMRYRRSAIGPFWISLSMAALVFGIAAFYSRILETDFKTYLGWLAVSFLVWGYLSATLVESCNALIEAEQHLRSVILPTPVLAARVVWRNTIILFHNLVVIVLVLAYAGETPGFAALYAVPGLAALCLFLWLVGIALGPVTLRFRDIGQLIASFVQILFFLTPVIWMPDQGRLSSAYVDYNPFYHLMQLIRAPLLGDAPTAANWTWTLGAIAIAALSAVVINRASRRKLFIWL